MLIVSSIPLLDALSSRFRNSVDYTTPSIVIITVTCGSEPCCSFPQTTESVMINSFLHQRQIEYWQNDVLNQMPNWEYATQPFEGKRRLTLNVAAIIIGNGFRTTHPQTLHYTGILCHEPQIHPMFFDSKPQDTSRCVLQALIDQRANRQDMKWQLQPILLFLAVLESD